MTHFLQSNAWAAFQAALGRTVISDQADDWKYQAILETGTLNRRLYTPYGPTAHNQASFEQAIASLKRAGRAHRATFIRVEPTATVDVDYLRSHGFKRVTYNQLQPEHTQIIDLAPTTDEILAGMSQNSRNLTRNYHKKDIVIHTSQTPSDITILTKLLEGVATRNHIRTHNANYFTKQAETFFPTNAATLYYATLQGEPIAAALIYDSDTTRYYAHAAANDQYRKLSAGTALLGQLILDAKAAGLAQVDLYGIAPSDDPSHPWAGFSKFKKSFGGYEEAYLGAWDLPLNHAGYLLYRSYQTLRRLLRR